jgi:DinB superfamily
MKLSRFAILTLLAPISLAAQQPPAGPPANPITAAFRTRISGLHRNIAQAFDSIPESKFGYKPTPAQLSIGYIAQHIANDDYFFCDNFGVIKGTPAAEDTATADSVKATWPKARLVARLRDSFAFCDQAIAQLDDAKLAEPVTITFGGNSRTLARAQMVLGHALDVADHYSQLANYMRLNNLIPPTALPRPRPSGS